MNRCSAGSLASASNDARERRWRRRAGSRDRDHERTGGASGRLYYLTCDEAAALARTFEILKSRFEPPDVREDPLAIPT
jgi:hypothetical protein